MKVLRGESEMILSAHQPVYLPGIILFGKIAISDVFMFLGHVQFSRTSWQTRNRIRNENSEQFLSVPVLHKGRFGQSIDQVEIARHDWKKKYLKSIYFTYKDRPFFDMYYPDLEEILNLEWKLLSDLNVYIIKKILECTSVRLKIK